MVIVNLKQPRRIRRMSRPDGGGNQLVNGDPFLLGKGLGLKGNVPILDRGLTESGYDRLHVELWKAG